LIIEQLIMPARVGKRLMKLIKLLWHHNLILDPTFRVVSANHLWLIRQLLVGVASLGSLLMAWLVLILLVAMRSQVRLILS